MTDIEKSIEEMKATLDRIDANNKLQLQALAGITGALASTLKGLRTLLDIDDLAEQHKQVARIDAKTQNKGD
jgi:hypothetical protein